MRFTDADKLKTVFASIADPDPAVAPAAAAVVMASPLPTVAPVVAHAGQVTQGTQATNNG